MLDLICRRYPGRRPSDYLELQAYEAFQLDYALAFDGFITEEDVNNSRLDAILSYIHGVAKVLAGGKGKGYKSIPKIRSQIRKQAKLAMNGGIPDLDDLLGKHGPIN